MSMSRFPWWYVPVVTGAALGIALGLFVVWMFLSQLAAMGFVIDSLGTKTKWWMP
jgi:hypothetical protein